MNGTATTDADDKGRAVQTWMSLDLMQRLDKAAEELGWSRSRLIARAAEYYLSSLQEQDAPRPRRAFTTTISHPPAP